MKIAVFLPNWIGDVVMATPALRALRHHINDAHIVGVMRPYVSGVLEGTNWLDEKIFLEKKDRLTNNFLNTALKLRSLRPDLAILFPNSFRVALTAWLGGCGRRIGYRRYGRGFLLTDALAPVVDEKGRLLPSPVLDAYNRLVQTAGCPDPGHRMELAATAQDESLADDIWQKEQLAECRELICLNPGAAFGAAKHWPSNYFAELAQKLVDERDSGVLVLCGPNEREQARRIVQEAGRNQVRTIADYALSIGLTKACVRRCDLLVTTDSGPRHFAAAFDKPVVSLFGPTHADWTITYHRKEMYLQKKVPCGPCQLRVCPLDHRCMTELSPQEVFDGVCKLMSRFHGQKKGELPLLAAFADSIADPKRAN